MKYKRNLQAGFTYLALLFFVATLGATLAAAGMAWSFTRQREKERELLYVGNQIRNAIENYYVRTPGAVKRYPATFNDLLRDNRQLAMVRHLRRLYMDPMTLRSEWGIVRASDGGIKGIFSISSDPVIKRFGFDIRYAGFENAKTYSDWKFVYEPENQGSSSKSNVPSRL